MLENKNDILVGILAGAIVIGTAAVIYANRKHLGKNLYYQFQNIKSQLNGLGYGLSNNFDTTSRRVKKGAHQLSSKANKLYGIVKKEIGAVGNPRNKQLRKGLLAGGILGGLLAAGAVVALTSLEREKGSEIFNWNKIIKGVKSMISDRAEELEEELEEEPHHHNPISNVIDFALSGAQLWQKFRNK